MNDFSRFLSKSGKIRYTYIWDELRRPIRVIVFSVFYTEKTRVVHIGHAPTSPSKKDGKQEAIRHMQTAPIVKDFSEHPIGFCKIAHHIMRELISN